MCLCSWVWLAVCVPVCVFVAVYVSMCVGMAICMSVFVCMAVCVWLYVCLCACVWPYVCLCACLCLCACAGTDLRTQTCSKGLGEPRRGALIGKADTKLHIPNQRSDPCGLMELFFSLLCVFKDREYELALGFVAASAEGRSGEDFLPSPHIHSKNT